MEKVTLIVEPNNKDFNVRDCVYYSLQIIKTSVEKMLRRRPADHIFLAGWGTSALLNHRVSSF